MQCLVQGSFQLGPVEGLGRSAQAAGLGLDAGTCALRFLGPLGALDGQENLRVWQIAPAFEVLWDSLACLMEEHFDRFGSCRAVRSSRGRRGLY